MSNNIIYASIRFKNRKPPTEEQKIKRVKELHGFIIDYFSQIVDLNLDIDEEIRTYTEITDCIGASLIRAMRRRGDNTDA